MAVSWPKPLPLFPDQVRDRHPDVLEEQLGGVLGVHPDLVEVASAREPVHPALDDQQRHAPVALGRIRLDRGDHEVGVDAVGDERLGAVDDVVVPVADRARPHPGQVGADLGLGHRHRGDQRSVGHPRQPALLLLGVAQVCEVGQTDVVVQRDPETAAGDAGHQHLLPDDLVEAEIVDPEPPVALGHLHGEHALVRRLGEQLAGHDLLALPLEVMRDDLLGDEAGDGLAEVDVL